MKPADVLQAFLAAPPLIAETIQDLSIVHPNWMRDNYEVEEFPLGNGTTMEQLVFRGSLPQIEEGMGAWKAMNTNTGCENAGCNGPDCGYNITELGGHGIERKVMTLGAREFVSPTFCVDTIQTTAHYDEIFAKIVETLYRQIDFIKEVNIGQNVMTMLAKKFVVDSNGPQGNPQNIYNYRPIGTTRLSTLNMMLLEGFYEQMRRLPDCVPYDVQDGQPIFALECSSQLLNHLYRDDPTLRQDVRFSGAATALLNKYNFITSIRGMFLPAPILTPRRFNWVNGAWQRVLPYVNNVPADAGAYTAFNTDYENAQYEEVIMHGKFPFKIFYLPTATTLGNNSSFGPEPGMFNTWQWINPQTRQDPLRRSGFFMTAAKIGVSQQFSGGIFSVLVERPARRQMATFLIEPECPPTVASCNNAVPGVGCPCPQILSVTPNPVTANHYFFQFAVPVSGSGSIQLGLDTGGYLTGTINTLSSDGLYADITITGTVPSCVHFTSIYCSNTLGCSSDVLSAGACTVAGGPAVYVVLKNPIKAGAGQVVTVYFCNGTSGSATVSAVDLTTSTYTLTLATGCLDNDNIVTVCVPPSTDSSCPACGGLPTITYCPS